MNIYLIYLCALVHTVYVWPLVLACGLIGFLLVARDHHLRGLVP